MQPRARSVRPNAHRHGSNLWTEEKRKIERCRSCAAAVTYHAHRSEGGRRMSSSNARCASDNERKCTSTSVSLMRSANPGARHMPREQENEWQVQKMPQTADVRYQPARRGSKGSSRRPAIESPELEHLPPRVTHALKTLHRICTQIAASSTLPSTTVCYGLLAASDRLMRKREEFDLHDCDVICDCNFAPARFEVTVGDLNGTGAFLSQNCEHLRTGAHEMATTPCVVAHVASASADRLSPTSFPRISRLIPIRPRPADFSNDSDE